MKKTLIKLSFLLFSISTFIQTNAQSDTTLIRQSFDNLKTALLSNNGTLAINLIDKSTFDFYAGVLLKAKTYDSIQTENIQLFEKILVFAVRIKGQKEKFIEMNDSTFFKYLADGGMVDKFGVVMSGTNLGSITVSDKSAAGTLLLISTPTPFEIDFRFEGNKWKVSLSSLIPLSNAAFKNLASSNGKKESEFILWWIKSAAHLKDESILWKPLTQ